jgi:ATP-dependent Clp protease ATP-binding subunit ClpC
MFERYTETARQAIFMARFEASQFGSQYIDTEHLLLGILRADGPLAARLLKAPANIESIREQIEKQQVRREKISTSVDLPLSDQCRRVLTYGAEEAEILSHKNITAEHLVLGLLRETDCLASKVMVQSGVTASRVKQEVSRLSPAGTVVAKPGKASPQITGSRDLTAAAGNNSLSPLIGRVHELERTIQILSRRTRNNPALIGEPGVGKNAIVHGLAQRIADDAASSMLSERRILEIDASSLVTFEQGDSDAFVYEALNRSNAILYIHGLFDLAGKNGGWSLLRAIQILEPQLANGKLQCIATGSPFGLRLTLERAEALASHFEVIAVLPPSEEEALRIVSGVKEQYEKFHGVEITEEALKTAIAASRWFLRHRQLPDRAIDLLDEAAARVKLRSESEPREMVEIRKRIRLNTRQMENAIANHRFDEARLYEETERRERQELKRLRAGLQQQQKSNAVTPKDIVEVVAGCAGAPVSLVNSMLPLRGVEQLERIVQDLAVQTGFGREWTGDLIAYLTECTPEDAENLAQAIRTAKSKIDRNNTP